MRYDIRLIAGVVCAGSIFLGLIHAASAAQNANEASYVFEFSPPDIVKEGKYDRVTMEGCEQSYKTGEPALPFKGAAILLPKGKSASDVVCETGEEVALPGTYHVEPSQQPFPLSRPDLAKEATPNAEIYNSNEAYPRDVLSGINPQTKRGYKILFVNMQPVRYVPAEGKLSYFKTLTLRVKFENQRKLGAGEMGTRDKESDRAEIRGMVKNPEMMSTY